MGRASSPAGCRTVPVRVSFCPEPRASYLAPIKLYHTIKILKAAPKGEIGRLAKLICDQWGRRILGVRGHHRALELGDMSPSSKAATCRRTPKTRLALTGEPRPVGAPGRQNDHRPSGRRGRSASKKGLGFAKKGEACAGVLHQIYTAKCGNRINFHYE